MASNSNDQSDVAQLNNPYGRMAVREWLFGVIKRVLESHGCEVNVEGVNVERVRFGMNGYNLKLVSSRASGPVSSVTIERNKERMDYDCEMVFQSSFAKKLIPDVIGLQFINEIMNALKLKCTYKVNNLVLLKGILEICEIPEEQHKAVYSTIGKMNAELNEKSVDDKSKTPIEESKFSDWSEMKNELAKAGGLSDSADNYRFIKLQQYVRQKGKGEDFLNGLQRSELANNEMAKCALQALRMIEKGCHKMEIEYDLGLPPTTSSRPVYTYFKVLMTKTNGEKICVALGGRLNNPAPRVNFTLFVEELIDSWYRNDLPMESTCYLSVLTRLSLASFQDITKRLKKQIEAEKDEKTKADLEKERTQAVLNLKQIEDSLKKLQA